MQKLLSAVCSAVLFCANIQAQNSISGTVLNHENRPLSGAHIHILQQQAVTDPSGVYQLDAIPSGLVSVAIAHPNYQPLDTLLTVNGNMRLDFRLALPIEALEVVVVKQKQNTRNASIAEQHLKAETIEMYSNRTLGDALKEVAGVSSLKSGSTVVKPVINGLYGSRVPVINNTVRLEDQEWGTEHAPNFDINSAGKITVIKGASGLQYGGDAIGGVVVIEPTQVKQDTLFGKTIVSLSSNGRGGTISSSLHKGNAKGWSWNALGTFKYMGDRTGPDYVLSNTGNREANFSGDIKYTGKKYDATFFYSYYDAVIGILSAAHIGNATDLFNSINSQVPYVVNDFTYSIGNPKQDVRHHLAKLNYNYYFNDSELLSLQYAFQHNRRLEFDLRRANFNDRPALDLELVTQSVNADYKTKFGMLELKLGANGSYQTNYASPETGISPLIPTYDKIDAGIYGVINYEQSNTLTWESGLRYDFSHISATKFYKKSRWEERGYDPEFSEFIVGEDGSNWLVKPNYSFHNLAASLGVHKKFDKGIDLFANVSLAARNPNPSEFFSDGLHHSTGQIELGNLALDKEKSYKATVTVQKKWTNFSIEVNPFVNYVADFIYLSPSAFETTIRGTYPVWEYNQTDARLFGIDVQTRWDINKRWQHHFSLGYVNGHDLAADAPLIDMPPLNFNNKLRFSVTEWNGLILELKHDVVCFQDRYPDNDFTTNIVVDGELVPAEVKISRPPPAYNLLDFYSEIKFSTWKKGTASLAFSVQNLLNTNYRDYLNRQRFFAQEVGRNFQLQLKINY